MADTDTVENCVLWPHLEPGERGRRIDILDSSFAQLRPAIMFITEGPDAALRLLREESSSRLRRALVETYKDFVSVALLSSVDNVWTGDGLNYRARWLAGRHVSQMCQIILDRGGSEQVVDDVVGPSLEDCPPMYVSQLYRLVKRDDQIVTAPGAWGDSDNWQVRAALSQVARSWATPPQTLEMLAHHPDNDVRAGVLSNPMAPESVLDSALGILEYPTATWADIDEEEHAVAVLSDPSMLPEELQEGVSIGHQWRRYVLPDNPRLPGKVIVGLLSSLAGTFLEIPVQAEALLHPACPGHVLAQSFVDSVQRWSDSETFDLDWPVACVGANPQTPPDSLAQFPDLRRARSIEVLSSMDVSVDEVVLGAAINPSTPPRARAHLATFDSEAISLALRATAD